MFLMRNWGIPMSLLPYKNYFLPPQAEQHQALKLSPEQA